MSVLSDYVELVRGKTYKGTLVGAPGPALLGLGSIVPGGGFRSDFKTYGGECPPELMLEPGDLFVSLKGATKDGEMIGSVARLPQSVPSGRLTQDTVRLVFRERDPALERYIYWLLRTPAYRSYCAGRATGSAVVALSRADFLSYPVPPLTRSRELIVEVLERLEDKIESNRRAREIISSLLVAAFQRIIEVNDVAQVPLGNLALFAKGVSYKSVDLVPSRTSLVTLKSFDRGGGYRPDGLKSYAGRFKPQQVITPGEIVVAQTDLTQGAEVIGRAVRVPADPSADILVASLDLVIVRPKDRLVPEYLLGVMTDENFRQHCRSHASGTTVLHLAPDAIPTYPVPLISPRAQLEFAATVRPLIQREDALASEIRGLGELRDVLLPEVLSGRIHVPEAVGVVEEAFA